MEARKVVENVQCINGGLTSVGTLRLTDFHLVFCAPPPPPKNQTADQTDQPPPKPRESWITYPILSQCILRLMPPTHGIHSSIRIRCRDFIFVTFNFEDNNVARDVFEFVKLRTCKLGTIERLFAFSHKPSKAERQINGWSVYDPKAEFRRQGISEKSLDKGWRLTNINKDFTFCDTYPAVLVVPSCISDNVLKYAKEYRSRHRIPALSYIHADNNCTITRSSQPLSGITRKNNVQDEKLVLASFAPIMPRSSIDQDQPPRLSQSDISEKSSTDGELSEQIAADDEPKMFDENGKRLIYGAQQANMIVDARPTVNAMVNQIGGMGSEPMDRYPGAKKAFMNIENIHVMRKSLESVMLCLKDADLSPLSPDQNALAATNWLKHTQAVLNGADIVAKQVWLKQSHVLIHCSDGWDRTSQLSALAQIMLDPFFRTIEGFIVLVEKDWLAFGHMFRLRCGHLNHEDNFKVQNDSMAGSTIQPGENDGRADAFQNVFTGARQLFNPSKEDKAELDAITEGSTGKVAKDEATVPKMVSPVFHQFVDCVYQLLRQNPTKFEFNERFLRRLIYHLYSCQYGTFLYNSEKQRHEARASERTSSVWDYFLSRKPEFTNKDYDPTFDEYVKGRSRIIVPDMSNIRWWHQLFNRTDEEMNSHLNAVATAAANRATAMNELHPTTEDSYANSQPGTPPHSAASPKPPSLPTSQSVMGGVENTHTTLTPDYQERQAPVLRRSVSAENSNTFSAVRDGIAGLNIGKNVSGMLNNLAGRSASPASTSRGVMFERMHEAPYTVEVTSATMKLDAELFYQENWADSTYTLSNWGDSTVCEWGTRAVANVATLSRDWSNLTDGLAEDMPDGDACADGIPRDNDGVCVNGDASADIDASSDTFSIHSLGRVSTEDVADNSNFILVNSSSEDLSAENGGSLVDSSMEDLSAAYGGSVISSH